MLDINLASYWIYSRLAGDAIITGIVGTRVYRDVAPQGAPLPCLVFQVQSSEDYNTSGVNRIFTTLTVVVKAIVKGASYGADAQTLAARADALLHNVNGGVSMTLPDTSIATGYCWAWRTRPFNLAEVSDGVQYRHLGGVYRVHAQVYGVSAGVASYLLTEAGDYLTTEAGDRIILEAA